jgi:hypothetical protein
MPFAGLKPVSPALSAIVGLILQAADRQLPKAEHATLTGGS